MRDGREEAQQQQQQQLRLDQLPVEIILHIFDYCHAYDLIRLSSVCTRFYEVVHNEAIWKSRGRLTLVTNQVDRRFRARCNPLLTPKNKWEVTHNWEEGKYQQKILFSHNTKLMPWIQLTEDILWWCGGSQLCGYIRKEPFNPHHFIFREDTRNEVCKFIVADNVIVSGHRNGSLKFWSKDRLYRGDHFYCSIENAHSRDVDTVDKCKDIVISGSADGTVKAWKFSENQTSRNRDALASITLRDRVWFLEADPDGKKVAVGSAGNYAIPLHIYDLETFNQCNTITHTWRSGAGILNLVWDDPNTLLTCGYDTCIRKWDLRTGNCVSYWTDPTDATIYCLSSDYNYSIVTGSQFNCKAVLWDQRKPQYVQLYFLDPHHMSSPIYSIAFDSTHLYGATDKRMFEMTFSGQPNIKKNYRAIIKY